MTKLICAEKYLLQPEAVDQVSDKLIQVLSTETEMKRQDILRMRLSAEEIMLNWMQDAKGEEVLLCIERQGKRLSIFLELQEEKFSAVRNPLKTAQEYGESGMTELLLSNLGMGWMHQITEGRNRVCIRVSGKKSNTVSRLAAAIFMALAVGALLKVLPPVVRETGSLWLIDPLFDTFLGLLSAIVAPMMFLSVVWGVFSIGNSRQLGTIGRKVCIRFLRGNVLAALLGGVVLVFFFPFQFQMADGGVSQLKGLLDMLYNIVPDNLLSPFLTGNTMQIIFMAIVVGVAMIVLQNQVPLVAAGIEQSNAIVNQILSVISRMIPVFVFLSILRIVLTQGMSNLGGFAKMILLYLGGCIILLLCYLYMARRRLSIALLMLMRKVLPTYLIALSTGSSAAAFSECTSSCTQKLGIKKTLVNFSIPLGIVVYMPNFALWLVLLGGACMQYSGEVLIPANVLELIFMAVFLAVAAPPIPGGGLACYTILLMQMGLPLELLAVASAINVILDFTGTAGNLFANQIELLLMADQMGVVDKEILHKEA